jgi:hypothetical protein
LLLPLARVELLRSLPCAAVDALVEPEGETGNGVDAAAAAVDSAAVVGADAVLVDVALPGAGEVSWRLQPATSVAATIAVDTALRHGPMAVDRQGRCPPADGDAIVRGT